MSILNVEVTLKSGVTYTVPTHESDYNKFRSYVRKYLDGQCTRTENYRCVTLGDTYFVTSEIAAFCISDKI